MTERSESERAELVAIAGQIDIFIKYGTNAIFEPDDAKKIASALRRLAAQDQEPVALAHVRLEDDGLFADLEVLDGTNLQPSMSPVALYLSPPPAAGWDSAALTELADRINTAHRRGVSCVISHTELMKYVTALRHNAPPDYGAGESEQPAVLTYTNYRGETSVRSIIPRSVRYGSTEWHPEPQWLLLAYDTEKNADREFALKDFGVPDHGGADAGVVWRSISEDTRWIDGRDVVLLANDMEVQARYCPGEWSDETPSSPREYSGAVWSCFDDQFQLEIEECSEDPSEWGHDGATHWRPISTHPHASDWKEEESRCTCGAGHGSLEGHTDWCAWVDASDCDKQGEAKCPECGGSGSIEIDDGHFIKCKCAPSDRTADVTEDQIARAWKSEQNRYEVLAFTGNRPCQVECDGQLAFTGGDEDCETFIRTRCASALLDAFTVGRR